MYLITRLARWARAALHTPAAPRTGKQRSRRSQPCLETLEDRCVPSTLSGFVYNDLNNNGTQDSGEKGIAAVSVSLTGKDSAGHSVSLSQTTGSDGSYGFTNLVAGTYSIK